MLAGGLGLERIGWIYTSRDHDTFMAPAKIQKAARLQQENLVNHQNGHKVPKFITVVLKRRLGRNSQPRRITLMRYCPRCS